MSSISKSKKVLITGSGGFLGKNLYKKLQVEGFEVIGLSINEGECVDYAVDLSNSTEAVSLVKRLSPDIIIHCAALTNVELCETEKSQAYAHNVLSTKNLCDASISSPKPCKFIYISSDYVYDGVKGNFTEDDATNPISYYAQTKLLGEKEAQFVPNYLILRTTVLFGLDIDGKNFFMQMLNAQKEKRQMKIPLDQINNPTYIQVLVEIILRSIKQDLKGIYLATGPASLGRYDFAQKLADFFGFDKSLLIPVATSELNQKAKRPLDCSTKPIKIQKSLKYDLPSLDLSLTELKELCIKNKLINV